MAERYKPVPYPQQPWEERFKFEARKHTRDPFPPGRKGEPIHERGKHPPGLKAEPARGKWKYVPG